jgi:hypothetical protein
MTKTTKVPDLEPDSELDDEPVICKCGNPGYVALCPYSQDLYGQENECNCCNECRYECAMDI